MDEKSIKKLECKAISEELAARHAVGHALAWRKFFGGTVRGEVINVSVKGSDCSCAGRYKFLWGPGIFPNDEEREALKIIIAGSLVERGLNRWSDLKRDDTYNKCGQNRSEIQKLLDEHCPQDTWRWHVSKTKELFESPMIKVMIEVLVKELLDCKSINGNRMDRILNGIRPS